MANREREGNKRVGELVGFAMSLSLWLLLRLCCVDGCFSSGVTLGGILLEEWPLFKSRRITRQAAVAGTLEDFEPISI